MVHSGATAVVPLPKFRSFLTTKSPVGGSFPKLNLKTIACLAKSQKKRLGCPRVMTVGKVPAAGTNHNRKCLIAMWK